MTRRVVLRRGGVGKSALRGCDRYSVLPFADYSALFPDGDHDI